MLQDAFVAAMSNLGRFDASRPFEAWLRRIALNKCRDRARRQAVRRLFGLSRRGAEEIEAVADAAASAEQALQASHAQQRLQAAITALPAPLKEALVATVLEGLSHKEAGLLLDISPKAVELRVYRAKRLLAETLERDQMNDLIDP